MSRGVSIHTIDPAALGPNSPLLALMRRKPRQDLEHQSQVKVFEWAAEHEATYPELRWMFAVPNWIGVRTAKQGARLKAEGRKPGVPDVQLILRRKGFVGLALELKVGKNRPTPEQRKWLDHFASQGWLVKVCYSFEEAKSVVLEYID